jgi:predicted phage terminase large subunit-like protein
VKNREDADSDRYREKTWAWFTADLRTRLKPGGRIVVIMTRWHEDDIGGRLIAQQGDRWKVLKLPAQALEDDPLGREPGEWLWADDSYGYGSELRKVRSEYEDSGAMRDWQALYQQDPRPGEGALFKAAMIDTLPVAPAGRHIARAWDLAATKQTGTRDPDWTVGVKLMRTNDGRFVVLDVVRLRGGPDEVEEVIVRTAKQDGNAVRIGLPQDPGQAGKQQVLYLTRKLVGFSVDSSPETGDKATRAAPVASQVNVGNFAVVQGPWNRPFIDELAGFPSGVKDDQVDALSRAFSMVGLSAPPMRINPAALQGI